MEEIKLFFDLVPAPMWGAMGAIFGAVIAFAATITSNYGNNKRLKIQLENDSKEKSIDRMNSLRREVYLSAIEEFSKAGNYLSSLPMGDIGSKNISQDLQGFFVAAAKLSLVATPRTQQAVDALGIEYSKLIFTVIQRVQPLQEISDSIKLNTRLYDQMMEDVRRVLGEITRFNEAGRTETHIFSALQSSFEFFSSQAKSFKEERGAEHDKFCALHEVFNNEMFRDMKPVARLQVEVMISVRNDLGIETDEAKMREKMEHQWAEISEAMDEALVNIKNNNRASDHVALGTA